MRTADAPELSLARIRTAAPSAEQEYAQTQAALIEQDTHQSEQRVVQLGTARRQAAGQFIAHARLGIGNVVFGGITGLQAFIGAKQAELMAAAGSALGNLRSSVVGGLEAAQTQVANARTRMNEKLESISNSVQTRVNRIAGNLSAYIDSVSLPDLPGVSALRGTAVRMLNNAAGMVNSAASRTAAVLGQIGGAWLSAADALLHGAAAAADAMLSIATAAVMNAMLMLSQALTAALGRIVAALQRLVALIVEPLLARLEALISLYIGFMQMRTLQALRDNRRATLKALADTVAPTAASPEPAADPPPGARLALLGRIGQRARTINRAIVLAFDTLSGGAFAAIARSLMAAATRLMAGVVAIVTQVMQVIGQALQQGLQLLQRIAQFVAEAVTQLIGFLIDGLRSLVGGLGALLDSCLERVVEFAQGIYERISGFVGGLIRSFINRITGSVGAAPVLSPFTLSAGLVLSPGVGPAGPITKPLPDLLVRLFRYVAPLVVAAVYSLLVILVGPELALLLVSNPVLFVITVVVLLILTALLLLLLYLLLKLLDWLIDQIPRPRPRKRIIKVRPARFELGVGGRTVPLFATVAAGAPLDPAIDWTVRPARQGVSVTGSNRLATMQSVHPPHGTLLGGKTIVVRAALASDPSDFEDSPPITLVQVTSASYDAIPALTDISLPNGHARRAPKNSGEPNRDGISGNKVEVNALSRPMGRRMRLEFRRALGASRAGTIVTPGSDTGDIGLRILDDATEATLDETLPASQGPAALMADLTINAVPTAVGALNPTGATFPPYGTQNEVVYTPSDTLHPPLTRIVGELITDGGDDFDLDPPNGGFNGGFVPRLAAPADAWRDNLITAAGSRNKTDNAPAIDVNRFVGPGVPQLPRAVIYRQRFIWSAWHGGGPTVSNAFADGQHVRSLIGTPGNFEFSIRHAFGSVAATNFEPYAGKPLIEFSNMVLHPKAPGATALAADNVATGEVGVSTTVAGRNVNWSIVTGDLSIVAGNPSIPPATMRVKAGSSPGSATIRAEDFTHPNRQLDGSFTIAAVALNNMRATDPVVPSGSNSTTVSLEAEPGGRVVKWQVDAASATAGVTVTPASTGPSAPAMQVTVTRPAGFTGAVTVTARDSVVAGSSGNVVIQFS